MSGQPKVSVIMPSLNVAPYIRECMDSVVKQTLKDIEIICIDAGSTDGTLEILREYAAKDERIHLLLSDKKSYGYQMNLGIAAAQGEYIGIVETDDFVEPDMYETLFNCANVFNAEVVRSNFYRYKTDTHENSFAENNPPQLCNKVLDDKEICQIMLTTPSTWSAVYRLEFLRNEQIRYLETPGASYQDTGFILKVLISAKRVVLLNEAFLHYRIDNVNSSVKSKDKVYYVCEEMKSAHQFLENHPQKTKRLQDALWARTAEVYRWNYNRLADKFRLEFLMRVKSDFQDGIRNSDIDSEYFSNQNWKMINEVVTDPVAYYKKNRGEVDIPVFEHIGKANQDTTCGAKVSVIIPIYNVEKYLRECLDSVVNQTLKDIEIICVNDGSLDDSLAIAEEYAAKDDRITLISQENGGQSAARNHGMRFAHGEYIYFIDSDDYILPNTLQELYLVSANNDCDIVYFGAESFFEAIELEDIYSNYKNFYYRKPTANAIRSKDLMENYLADGHFVVSVPVQFFRKNFLTENKILFLNGIIHEDELFSPIALSRAKMVQVVGENYYRRRVRKNSTMTQVISAKQYEGQFISAVQLLSETLKYKDGDITRKFLFGRAKLMWNTAKRTYAKLAESEKAKVFKSLPEEYHFLLMQLEYVRGDKKPVAKAPTLWLSRKTHGAIQCIRDHGFFYTIRLFCKKAAHKLGR